MKKRFTRFFATVVVSMAFSMISMAQLAYNVPFSIEDWDWESEKKTLVAVENEVSWSNENGICLGNATGDGFDYDDKYVVIALAENGTPDRLQASTLVRTPSSLFPATGVLFSVSASADNETFEQVWKSESKNNTIDVELPATTKFVKLLYSGNFAGYFKNLTVTSQVIESDVEDVVGFVDQVVKVIRNGQLLILKDNQLYDSMGRLID